MEKMTTITEYYKKNKILPRLLLLEATKHFLKPAAQVGNSRLYKISEIESLVGNLQNLQEVFSSNN
jgi:hypothetical protein